MRRGSSALRVACLVCTVFLALLSASQPVTASVGPEDWLGRVNEIRQSSQLPPVSENSSWNAGITAHLTYLELTPPGYMSGEYASAHTENPESPYYTPEGDQEGRSSDLAYGSSSNVDAIDEWLAAPFHAIGILRPGLQQVGFARDPSSGYAGLDVINGWSGSVPPTQVLFPGLGSTIDLTRFGGESPTPIETCEAQHSADYSSAGLPLIALLTESPEAGLSASLTGPDGSSSSDDDDLCVVTANNFVSSDPIYGSTAESILAGDRAVLVIPRRPLRAGTYSVDISQPGRPDIAWSFNSSPPSEPTPGGPESGPVQPGPVEFTRLIPRSRPPTGQRGDSGECVSCSVEVEFLRPNFARHVVSLVLDNSDGSGPASFEVLCSGRPRRTYDVGVGGVSTVTVRLRGRGASHVTVKVGSEIVSERTFRPHFRRR
jgi:hypothetical protein